MHGETLKLESFIARNPFSIKASGRHSVYTIAKAIYGSFLFLLPTLVDSSVRCPGGRTNVQTSGFHSVVRGSQVIRDQFPGDSWMHFCNVCFEVGCFVKSNGGTSLIWVMFISYNWRSM